MKKILTGIALTALLGAGCSANGTTDVQTNVNTNVVAPSVPQPTTQQQPATPPEQQATIPPANQQGSSSGTVNAGSNVNVGGTVNAGTHVAATMKVSIKSFAFSPSTITVKKGDTVIFTNNDATGHTVTADNGMFGSGTIQQGGSFTLDTSKLVPGGYNFHCAIHPTMKGTLTIQ